MNRIAYVLGAALAFAPAMALANQGHDQNQPEQPHATQDQNLDQNQNQNQYQNQNQNQMQGQSANQNQPDLTTQKLLPKDAKLVGAVESADVREFPEQRSEQAKQSSRIEKEGVVGVGALDRVWTTRQSYKQTVSHFDQKLKGEGIEPIAKTTTQSSTAWNVRMPDGHIANVVVRNTQPTTIESVQVAAMLGTMTGQQPGQEKTPSQQQPSPSSKTKSNDHSMNQR